MTVLSITSQIPGLVGVVPNLIFINTNDTATTILTAGYLNNAHLEFPGALANNDMALVQTSNDGVQWFQVSITGIAPNLTYSLIAVPNPGGAIFPGDVQAGMNGVNGGFISYPLTANRGHLYLEASANTGNTINVITNAAQAAARTFTIPDPGAATANFILSDNGATQHITTGSLEIDTGNALAGSSGHAGEFISYPGTATRGRFIFAAANSAGNTDTVVTNASMGQATTFTIPDPGAATANVIVSASAGAATQHITTGGLELDTGNFYAGSSGTQGAFVSFPTTATRGTFQFIANNSAGNTATILTHASMGQATTFNLPDPGAAIATIQLTSQVKAHQTANIGGAGAGPLNVVVAGLTAASVVVASIVSSSNPCSVIAVAPGAGSFNITVSADPGANLVISYVAYIAAQ